MCASQFSLFFIIKIEQLLGEAAEATKKIVNKKQEENRIKKLLKRCSDLEERERVFDIVQLFFQEILKLYF